MYISSNSGSDVNKKNGLDSAKKSSNQIIFEEMYSVYFKVF